LPHTEGADIRSCPERRDIVNRTSHSPEIRPKAPLFVLLVLCAFAVVGLTHCNMTADKVTGVTMDHGREAKSNRGDCVSDCAHAANDAMDDEKELHVKNVKACHGDQACLNAEEARHNAAVDAIQEERRHCIEGCHHQGGGHGR
jgi:hypothetical protein